MVASTTPSILIFDSGVGGLSVFDEIQDLLPQVNYYYLFDNEAYPYGELAHETLVERTTKLIEQFMRKHTIDLVVIACNTASTVALPALREFLSVPVVGVVPAIKPASTVATIGIGLIATPATVTRPYTHELIKDFAQDKPVELLGSTRLVEMAEHKLRSETIDLIELEQILFPLKDKVDVAVLGCTHFPLLKEEIQQVLGEAVLLVDSGNAIARRVKEILALVADSEVKGKREIFSSATPFSQRALEKTISKWGFATIQSSPLET
ncbi:glutamate racemase [Vibrio astriarenae]|uniref:Glutamate racemase n=1 Tax=Vibrio astriarenae TaxID=1481923 RepID=A0A7Z2T0R9_9VIBR|nr:glutamate racemase [Vibrio astriarenae]QIA62204.1 glutamate racemase [Vibrio astriarenae]GAL16267.1 glutamate racemase [Vibrio sp. C7]